jgi:hypothetical protein
VSDAVRRTVALLLALAAQPLCASNVGGSDYRESEIQARLLYEQTGSLSVDLTAHPEFAVWNVIIGEGSAIENADDLLVSAVIDGDEESNSRTPLIITVRDAHGKVIVSHKFKGMLLEKKTVRSILLHEVGCAGELHIEARFGVSVRNETISMDCGE